MLAAFTSGYDGASRLTLVSDGTDSATYSYLANSPLVSNILLRDCLGGGDEVKSPEYDLAMEGEYLAWGDLSSLAGYESWLKQPFD